MIKTILTLIITILKNKTYMAAAKEVWNIVDENFRITEKVEDKLKSKAEEFNKLLLAKFPELSQSDIDNLRQSIAGEINQGKPAVVDNSSLLQQLQSANTVLQAENTALKNQIAQIQSAASTTVNSTVNNTDVNQQQATVVV